MTSINRPNMSHRVHAQGDKKQTREAAPLTLSDRLIRLTNGPAFSVTACRELEKAVDAELKHFDANIIELGRFFSDLYGAIDWRVLRLSAILEKNNPDGKNKAINKALIYLADHKEEINEGKDKAHLDAILAMTDPALHADLKKAWNESSPANDQLQALYRSSMSKVRNIIKEKIAHTSIRIKPDMTYFSEAERAAVQKDDPRLIDGTYTKKDLDLFQRTVKYLSGQKDPEQALYLVSLYVRSTIAYSFNRDDIPSAKMVALGKSDCSEMNMFIYRVLKTVGRNDARLYISVSKENPLQHLFGATYLHGKYYVYDQNMVVDEKGFGTAVKELHHKNGVTYYIDICDPAHMYEDQDRTYVEPYDGMMDMPPLPYYTPVE